MARATWQMAESFLGVSPVDRGTRPDVVILGVPVTSPYPGRPAHATDGPRVIREASARLSRFVGHHDFDTGAPFAAWHARVADAGDLSTHPERPEDNRSMVRAAVGDILASVAVPVVLGGDDSTVIPVLQAYQGHGPLSVVQVDAHLDFRDEVDGERYGYSSPMRRASEMAWVRRIVHVGQRGVGSARPHDVRDSLSAGGTIITARDLETQGVRPVARLLDPGEPFLMVLDVDGIDPREAPAVRAPVASGPSVRSVTELLVACVERGSLRGMVITELEPPLDVNGITARNVARLICRVLDAALPPPGA